MPSARVEFMSGPDDGLVVALDSEDGAGFQDAEGWIFTIGRRDTSDIAILYDTQVSRDHARLVLRKGTALLQDMNSRNGCIVRGERIKEAVGIHVGELFQVGRTWLHLDSVEGG